MSHPTLKLADIAAVNPQITPEDRAHKGPVPLVQGSGLCATNATVAIWKMAEQNGPKNGFRVFRNGDILVANAAPAFLSGRVAQAVIDAPFGLCSNTMHVVRVTDGAYCPRFLLHHLRQKSVRAGALLAMGGSKGGYTMPWQYLAGLDLLAPPLGRQQRLAQLIDLCLEQNECRRQAIAVLDGMKQALFASMFERTPDILSAWPVATMEAALESYATGAQSWGKHRAEQGPTMIFSRNLTQDGTLQGELLRIAPPDDDGADARRARLAPGDIVVDLTSNCRRNIVITPALCPSYITSDVLRLRAGPAFDPYWLASYLCSDSGQQELDRAKKLGYRPNLCVNSLLPARVPMPPLELQRRFTADLEKIGARRVRDAKLLARELRGGEEFARLVYTGVIDLSDEDGKPYARRHVFE